MTSNEIIQVVGVLYFIFGLAFLFNRKYYRTIFKEMYKSKLLLFAGGYIALTIGIIIILNFNSWTFTKDGLITFLGWVAFLKGGFLILFPDFMSKTTKMFMNSRYLDLMLMGVAVLGLILMYLGFVF